MSLRGGRRPVEMSDGAAAYPAAYPAEDTADDRSDGTAEGNGGNPARRAVVRWTWRLFRREWRQQALVLALLTVAVAAAIGFASAAYNIAPDAGNAEFGTANNFFRFDDPDPATLPATLTAAEEWFGAIDAIGHRPVAVPGSVETVDYRAQDPEGSFGGPMLDLRDGRYPATDGEVAVTDWVAETFSLAIGDSFDLDGVARVVVGLVENPSNLGDKFALLAPSATASSEWVSVLVDADFDRVQSFRPPDDKHRIVSSRGDVAIDVFAAVTVLAVAALALFLVALVAAASFVVVAQRRLRQLGMLDALGATEKHLRLVMVANGLVSGAVAALLGAVVGIGGWIVIAPRLEGAIGSRIDEFNIPWWLVATGMLLAVVAAAGAAWWPARTMARIPTVLALSGRPPQPRAVHRSAALAGSLVLIGVLCLTFAGDLADETAVHWTDVLLVCAGALAVVLGVLLVSPLAIRALAWVGARTPIAVRLALRDLARYQARSGAALAAISLVLGIPVAIVVTAAANEHGADAGNLADHQLLVRAADVDGPFVPAAADVADLQAGVDLIAASFDEPTVVALDVAVDPAMEMPPDVDGLAAVSIGVRFDEGWRDLTMLYVATPELLDYSGLDLDAFDQTDILTSETGELRILGVSLPRGADRSDGEAVEHTEGLRPAYSALPGSFVTQAAVLERGWEVAASGRWLVDTGEPLTSEQLATAREIASSAGLAIESRDQQRGLATLRTGATGVGMLLALGVLAMTVGLIRSEAAGDLRTLTAAGATSGTRRTLTAATGGGLALLGVVLGTVGAYIALAAGSFSEFDDLSPVPVQLAVLAIGTPAVAAAGGWLLAGRGPSTLARQPIE